MQAPPRHVSSAARRALTTGSTGTSTRTRSQTWRRPRRADPDGKGRVRRNAQARRQGRGRACVAEFVYADRSTFGEAAEAMAVRSPPRGRTSRSRVTGWTRTGSHTQWQGQGLRRSEKGRDIPDRTRNPGTLARLLTPPQLYGSYPGGHAFVLQTLIKGINDTPRTSEIRATSVKPCAFP